MTLQVKVNIEEKTEIWIFNAYTLLMHLKCGFERKLSFPTIIFKRPLFQTMQVKLCSLDCIRVLSQNCYEFYNISHEGAVPF